MTNKAAEERNYLCIERIGKSIAKHLGADKKMERQLTRVDHLWKHYKYILNWNITNNHNWIIGGNKNLITYTQNLFYREIEEHINTNTEYISFKNVTGYVYLARLLLQYPSFKNYLNNYVDKVAKAEDPAQEQPAYNGSDASAEEATNSGNESTASSPMPDLYYSLWERTGDELYLRYLQSILYVLNQLGSANLTNDRDKLEPDNMVKTGKQQPDDQYYDNVVAYCLFVILKFENKEFGLSDTGIDKRSRLYKSLKLPKNTKLNLNRVFGIYRDHYLEKYNELIPLFDQTLGLIGCLNTYRSLNKWQIERLTALSEEYSRFSKALNNRIDKAEKSKEKDRRIALIKDIESCRNRYDKLIKPNSEISKYEYEKLKKLSEQFKQMVDRFTPKEDNT